MRIDGFCPKCGYAMSGRDPARCPECGVVARPAPRFRAGREYAMFFVHATVIPAAICGAGVALVLAEQYFGGRRMWDAAGLARGALLLFFIAGPLAVLAGPFLAHVNRRHAEDGWVCRQGRLAWLTLAAYAANLAGAVVLAGWLVL